MYIVVQMPLILTPGQSFYRLGHSILFSISEGNCGHQSLDAVVVYCGIAWDMYCYILSQRQIITVALVLH